MAKELTNKQMDIIEKHLDVVERAYRQHYVRSLDRNVLDELNAVYLDLGYRSMSIACNSCVISILSTLGARYFNQLEINKNKPTEAKRGRKPKVTN